ncbi:MBL fold metallo-hydrolase [Puteibacter caeruleilacunae]|nr:MBL fold metallo-hydrolase [Puteibacter caeruleilacunae]
MKATEVKGKFKRIFLGAWRQKANTPICPEQPKLSGKIVAITGGNRGILWCSWIIKSEHTNIYFSGDGGYADHFKEIGEKYGPFDFAMMECGQYNEKWPHIHMFPEQTAQAGIDIKAKQLMPKHWGAFRLSQHAWTEPVERVIAAAKKLDLPLVIPKIGESIIIQNTINYTKNIWWENH